MAWVKVESSVSRNRKFQQAGPAASWLWICGLSYCQEGLTDGFIPFESVAFLGVKTPKPLVTRLVRAGLWDVCEGGWRVHDYLDHNRTATEVRRVQGERRKSGGEGGRISGLSRRVTDQIEEAAAEARAKQIASTGAEANAKQTANPALTATATATDRTATASTVAAGVRPQGLIQPRRKDAAWEGPRVWVPQKAHDDFIRFRNHKGAEAELLKWYEVVSDAWTTGASADKSTGASMFDFWRARFDEAWPAAAAARTSHQPAWLQKAKAANAP